MTGAGPPICRICDKAHWSSEPHQWTGAQQQHGPTPKAVTKARDGVTKPRDASVTPVTQAVTPVTPPKPDTRLDSGPAKRTAAELKAALICPTCLRPLAKAKSPAAQRQAARRKRLKTSERKRGDGNG